MGKSCEGCRYNEQTAASLECMECDVKYSGWVKDVELVHKDCGNCAFEHLDLDSETCTDCDQFMSRWAPAMTKSEAIKEVMKAHPMIPERKGVRYDTFDAVKKPSHYIADDGTEVKDVLTSFGYHKNSHRWNAGKYILRAGRKDSSADGTIRDLNKAKRSIEYEIALIESGKL